MPLSPEAVAQLNHCNKCGFCLPACPTYAVTHEEMHSPRGRLALVEAAWRGELNPEGGLVAALSACLGCRACEVACPSGVEYGKVLEDARADLYRRARRYTVRSPLVTVLLTAVRHRGTLRALARAGRFGRRMPLPGTLKRAAQGLPPVHEPDRATQRAPSPAARPATHILYFATCVMDSVYPDTNRHAMALLAAAGGHLEQRPEQCCGALHLHTGDRETARALARANLAAWRDLPEDTWIVAHAGGCAAMLREYGDLLHDDPEWRDAAQIRSAHVLDFAEALARLPLRPQLKGSGERVGLQNSCHLVNVLRAGEWPVAWLQHVDGDTFVALPSQDRCCGSAGVYNFNEPAMAQAILGGHLDEVETARLDRWIVNNPGCAMQCQAGVAERESHTRVTQLADYLYSRWTGAMEPNQEGLRTAPDVSFRSAE
jgi:glycolate oxidase iron-sulfur subunit